ncbi:MAG TPA: secretin and TonB N-terminal domain-containing protein, partial [Candidatus Binatia bacterium]|nr:secretin and TonB N-terminal domain-containing protein [Candidatus Binatia bacterium]
MMGNMLMDGLTWRFARSYGIQAKTCTWVGMMALTGALGVSGCSVNGTTPTQSPAAQTPATAKPAAKSQSAAAASYPIRDLIVREEKGQTFLQIKFGQPVTQYRHFTLPQPARIVLDVLDDVKSAETADLFRIDTGTVATLRLTSGETNLRLVLETSSATVPTYSISPDDGGLTIVVGTLDPNINAKRSVVLVQAGQRVDVRRPGALTGPTELKPMADVSAAGKPYTGQKISLDFKDADIKNVFRLLADVSGLNIVVTSDVNRRVTLRLVEVPWDQAMDLIIATNGLEKEQIGNVVRISTADALKGERDKLIAAKESREKLDPIQTIYFTLNYARAKDLEPKIRPLMSKRTDAALVIDDRSNTIMVRDIQKSLDDVSTMVGKLDSRTPQILIESNLVETTPSFSRALGMELDSVFNDGRIITSSRFLAGAPFAGSPQGIANQLIVPSSGFRFGYFGNNIRGILSAAENEGNIKIISRPSIVTLNNIPSTIKSERILRITLPSSTNIASGSGAAAGTAVATEKIPVGINLTVIPQVSSDGFVLLNIKVKSSSIANSPTVAGGTGGVVPF